MPLTPGEPAEAWDTWLRIITNRKYLKADGTLTSSAFTGKAIAPPKEPRPWSVELSGAVLSMITDLQAYGGKFGTDKFVGYMFREVSMLRNAERRTDVVYTPNEDTAHADLVSFRESSVEAKFALRDLLQETIRCVRHDNLDPIEALRRRL